MAESSLNANPLLIGVIVFDHVMALDYIGPTAYLEQLPSINVPIQFETISLQQGPIKTLSGLPLYASKGYKEMIDIKFDILLIPGGRGRLQVINNVEFLQFIKKSAQEATHVLTVCTGSSILAATGLLDGRRATTNKLLYDEIAENYPNVRWVRQARWVTDGNIWTASGITAGQDMAHAYISKVYGEKHANTFAHYQETVPNTDSSNDPFA